MKASEWMKLDPDIKADLKGMYTIIKTGCTDVRGNEVICDGYTDQDLEKVELSVSKIYQLRYGKKQDGTGVVQGIGSKEEKRTNKRKAIPVPTE